MEGVTITREIDARGSFCPGPMMELIRVMKTAAVGDVIAVLSGDRGSRTDIPKWLQKAGQEFVGVETQDGFDRIIARKVK